MRAGDCSLPWEPELVSPCFTFYSIGQGRVVCFGCCLGVWFALFFIVPDLSFCSRCLTMTILAQPNDCHSCNDARSIVQKKKVWSEGFRRCIFWYSCNGYFLEDWFLGNVSFLPIGFLEERSFRVIWEALEMLRGAWSEWREFVLVSRF